MLQVDMKTILGIYILTSSPKKFNNRSGEVVFVINLNVMMEDPEQAVIFSFFLYICLLLAYPLYMWYYWRPRKWKC